MAEPEVIVSSTIRIQRPEGVAEALRSGQEIPVELDGGRSLVLSSRDERTAHFAEILAKLQEIKQPVYLEVDRDTKAITRLLIPHVSRVLSMKAGEGDSLDVELYFSAAKHALRRDNKDFGKFEETLRNAAKSGRLLVISEDDAHNIVDVREFTPGPDGAPPLPFPEPLLPPGKWPPQLEPLPKLKFPWWPWPWERGCISSAKAQSVFDAMAARSCDPLTVPPPCIPFRYPDDGCWGRAHEMCRLMIDMNLSPKKVWIEGSLRVQTKNNPQCFVRWGWHVAPTLRVRRSFFFCRTMVIDPSLFTTPVTEAEWKGVQGDVNATLTPSEAAIFYLWGGVTDPTYVQTNQVLATYRLQLQLRSQQVGPPPYNCP